VGRALRILALVCWWPVLTAQTPPLVRGVLLERDTETPAGEFSVRAGDNQVFRYQFDRKTYVEREDHMIEFNSLQPGEKVEVVSDVVPGSIMRYARTIHVMPDAPPLRPPTAGRLRAYRSASEHAIPAGNLTFSGVVFRLNGERLVLHTREGGEQSLLLRKDTRYVANGEIVGAEALKLNMRVFVRGGKDLYDQVEAYQVIWGAILEPK
jgi:hypothetical protein